MLWLFLLLAIAVVFLTVTNRVDALDGWVSGFVRKVRSAWDYAREDVEDIEHELREKARASEPGANQNTAGPKPAPKPARAAKPKPVDRAKSAPEAGPEAGKGKEAPARAARPRKRRMPSAVRPTES